MTSLITPEFCYLIGVLQTDGSFYNYKVRRGEKEEIRYMILASGKDLPMVKRSKEIFEKSFDRKVCISKKPNHDSYIFEWRSAVKKLLPIIDELKVDFKDPPKPPEWIDKIELFGPYLAGVIDGDGDICIKRPEYPQCQIRIASGSPQTILRSALIKHINCSAYISRAHKYIKQWCVWTTAYRLCFVVSPKNFDIFEKYVIPYITIDRKRTKIEKYLRSRARNESRTRLDRFL